MPFRVSDARTTNVCDCVCVCVCVPSTQVYCLPDNYEVVDRSLDDVRYMLNPRFTTQDVAKLDTVRGACVSVCVCVCACVPARLCVSSHA